MSAYANKTQYNKRPATTDTSVKQIGSGPVAQFKNNRPEAVMQRRLQAAADNSLQVKQLKAIQLMAGNRQGEPIQPIAHTSLQTIKTGKVIQGKFVIQRNERDNLAPAPQPDLEQLEAQLEPEADDLDEQEHLLAAEALNPVIYSRDASRREARAIERRLYFDDSTHPPGRAKIPQGWQRSNLRDMNYEEGPNRVDVNGLTRIQKAEYGVLGGAVLTSAAGGTTGLVAGKGLRSTIGISDEAAQAPMIASHSLGIGAGALGAASDLRAAFKTAKDTINQSNTRASKVQAGLETAGSVASATKSGLSTWLSTANLMGAAGGIAAGTAATAGAGIAMGGLDMVGGLYGFHQARKRGKNLSRLRTNDKDIGRAAKIGAGVQSREKLRTGMKAVKGAASIAGGVLLLLGASLSPIGWGLLAGGSLLAGSAAIANFIRKRRQKKDIVIDILGIKPLRDRWKADKKAIEGRTWRWSDTRKREMARIGEEDPLNVALRINGYTDIGHCYNNYLGAVAGKLHDEGVLGNDKASINIIYNLGLRLDGRNQSPSATEIAAKLSI